MIINSGSNSIQYKSLKTDTENRNADNTAVNGKTREQLDKMYKEKVSDLLDPTNGMSDEEKSDYEDKINQKIKNGGKLSESEMRYLRMKNPYLYAIMLRVQMQRKALEDRLKNCRSKEEAEEAYSYSMSHIKKDDPAREPLQAAYKNVMQEFKKSSEYKRLPQKTDDTVKKEKLPIKEIPMTEKYETDHKYLQTDEVTSVVDIIA